MFRSESISRDNFKNGEYSKSNSDFFQTQHPSHESTQQQQQSGNGLARYRSAPSSFFATLLSSDTENSSSGDESEAIFSAFMNGPPIDLNQNNYDMKQEVGVESEPRPWQNNGFGSDPRPAQSNGQMGAVVGSYSVGMKSHAHVRGGNESCGNNNLVRQSSSPAGFYGFNIIGELGNYKVQNRSETSTSATGLNNHINFSFGQSSSSRFMPSIPEAENVNIISTHVPENGRLINGSNVNGVELDGSALFQNSWNETPFSSLKRNRDGELKMFSTYNGLENRNGETRKNSSGLVHQMSMPNTSSEVADMEKYLQFQQDVVPYQIRAKRGCATAQRSIAERNRRTKISARMKKLQDLFPDMDKQTSIADMLDLSVEHIKELQKQVQTLTDTRAKCTCSGEPKQSNFTT